jgi:tricorn protease
MLFEVGRRTPSGLHTPKVNNRIFLYFIYSLDQKKSFQITDAMANCKIPAWDKSVNIFILQLNYGMNVGWLDMSSYDHP